MKKVQIRPVYVCLLLAFFSPSVTDADTAVGAAVNAGASVNAEFQITPDKGLNVFVSKEGGRIRLFRQLSPPPPPSSAIPAGPTPTSGSTSTSGSTRIATLASGNVTQPTSVTPTSPPPPPMTGQITVVFSALREVDAAGNAVAVKQGLAAHTFSSFSSQDFNFTAVNSYQIPNSNGMVVGDCLNFDVWLSSPSAHFQAMACVLKTNGTMTLGDEVTMVSEGQLKFSVEVDHWQWCDSACTTAMIGAYLEMDIILQTPSGRSVKDVTPSGGTQRRPRTFSLGADATTNFSSMVCVDGVWQNMSAGYPKLTTSSQNQFVVTLRFPRFNSSVFYDPVADPGYTVAASSNDGGGGGPVGSAPPRQLVPWTAVVLLWIIATISIDVVSALFVPSLIQSN